jgi:hypothetical protein
VSGAIDYSMADDGYSAFDHPEFERQWEAVKQARETDNGKRSLRWHKEDTYWLARHTRIYRKHLEHLAAAEELRDEERRDEELRDEERRDQELRDQERRDQERRDEERRAKKRKPSFKKASLERLILPYDALLVPLPPSFRMSRSSLGQQWARTEQFLRRVEQPRLVAGR